MTPTEPSVQPTHGTDRHLLRIYLDDHLAGASAGATRMQHAAERLTSTPVGADLQAVADEVAAEKDELRGLLDDLDLPTSPVKEALAAVGERLGALKPNGALRGRSPMTALLEVELLRSAVTGKKGLWQTLLDLSGELGLDGARMAALVAQSDRQIATLDRVHAYVRTRALRDR